MPNQPAIQYRTAFDFRASETDPAGFEGYASTFWAADTYATAIAPGAFRKSIRERGDKIPVLWNHNPDVPIGKHLALKEDKTGLFVNIGVADDGAEGSTFLARMRFGVPFGMSFGFQTVKDRTAEDDDPIELSQLPGAKRADIRVITEVKYWESSPVTFPANEAAGITATRAVAELDYLNTLLDSMRAGTLSDEQTAALDQLLAAHNERTAAAEAERLTALATDRTRRDRDIALQIALATGRAQGVNIP